MDEHAEIYKAFAPMMATYTDMAKHVLEIQIEIFSHRLKAAYPKAAFDELVLIATISARETPDNLTKLLNAMEQKQVVVKQIVYDSMNYAYHIYGSGK